MSSTLETTIILPAILVILLSLICLGSNLSEKVQKEFEIEYISIANGSKTDKLYHAEIISDEKGQIFAKSVIINPVSFVLTVDLVKDLCCSFVDIKNDLIEIFGEMS